MISTPRRRLAAYVLVIAVMAAGLWRVETTANRAENTAHRLDAETELDAARRCVNTWEVREDIRDAIERGARVSSEALIAVVPDAPPPTIADYRSEVDAGVQAARGEVEDPDCDLEAAERRLADQ